MSMELLEYGFMHRALAAGLVTAVVCPTIGAFLIPRRLALVADSLAHVALAGVALGVLVGAAPLTGALVTTGLGAVAIERLRSRGLLQGDAALAVVLSAGFAIAVVLISLARAVNADLFALLFGSLLTVSPSDVWVIGGLGLAVLATVRVFYAQLFAITVSEDLARASGVRVAALNLMLTVLTALTVVIAMRLVGVLLVGAMVVVPTLAGFTAGRSFRQALGLGIGVAVASVVLGLVAAFHLGLAAGGAIALVALLLLAVIALVARDRGDR
jgi:zinc transport system permease protein